MPGTNAAVVANAASPGINTSNVSSRCPHVVLIGSDTAVDPNHQTSNSDSSHDPEVVVKCDECGARKHLWACLRAQCNYVGCGRDTGGHSKQHALLMHHPLAINLATRNVWCEMCDTRVYLDRNEPRPPSSLNPANGGTIPTTVSMRKSSSSSSAVLGRVELVDERDPSLDECVGQMAAACCDDFELVSYLDQENGRGRLLFVFVVFRVELF